MFWEGGWTSSRHQTCFTGSRVLILLCASFLHAEKEKKEKEAKKAKEAQEVEETEEAEEAKEAKETGEAERAEKAGEAEKLGGQRKR